MKVNRVYKSLGNGMAAESSVCSKWRWSRSQGRCMLAECKRLSDVIECQTADTDLTRREQVSCMTTVTSKSGSSCTHVSCSVRVLQDFQYDA